MDLTTILLIIGGLALFEIIVSVDNAIVNADVLGTMSAKARRWFLIWGLLFAVFIVRGLLPWVIVWVMNPSLGFFGSLTATFSSDPSVIEAIEKSTPILLAGGGVFLIFIFFHWLFLEPKHYGLIGERFFHRQGAWFYAVVSIILCVLVWSAIQISPYMAFSIVVGSSAFFITHGFKQTAEESERELVSGTSHKSDIAKIMYLEVIDTTFSIDGVLGAFAFTLSIPLIILGNGIGALVLRQLTVGNIDRIRRYMFIKNGAMYSILALGIIMLADAFGHHIPHYVSPLITFAIVGYFFLKSHKALKNGQIV